MQASADMVVRHAAEARRALERGDKAWSDYQASIAAEHAVYAEMCARRAYGLPVAQQQRVMSGVSETRRGAWRATH